MDETNIDAAPLHMEFEGVTGSTFLLYAEDPDLPETIRQHIASMTPIEAAVIATYAREIVAAMEAGS